MTDVTRPGPIGFRISANSPAPDWQTLDGVWAAAGESGAFDAGWMSDHLADVSRSSGGNAFEPVAAAGALAHRVAGLWVGVVVFANTFRHPAVLAKSATVLDNATGGRFVLGIGAGWHAGEHEAFGLELGAPKHRVDRLASSLQVLTALFSDAAARSPGVTVDDPYYPLRGATLEPAPIRAGGPPIWLGGQGPRGLALAVRHAGGWPMPGNRPGDVAYFAEKSTRLRSMLEAAGRDPASFTFAAQVECHTGSSETRADLELARSFVAAGANHVILALPAAAGVEGVSRVARNVARPLREELDK
jgi:alkanesulfonate monooxygenase SsuD/methylene tetrahydromethanopterin reductase-like flavin-dependent oxidoreductase (luciferase family)